ncbi:hypothetical protein GUITHDRAFT_110403 [Guillardia theta CCMP2712]|uniref:Uncharacterized protein n=1 Tax=Guillardia theta (strain CCMP2712) TaxID=905079 RepID=L1J677_GUITC|nr:hypothetical protein GUITHDRAFT_110403 [Guillardia theta CCMP2712]EKX43600.1 hypothetical protein GUITHDRAFT_110403 [Guillardia theta CCMP2712]|eukprot:XP_005830580.1 hypothetical protein GUITHDRAFT_110403 [Guillardia theta CCMP2712]
MDLSATASQNSGVMAFLYNLLFQALLIGKKALIFIFEDLTIEEYDEFLLHPSTVLHEKDLDQAQQGTGTYVMEAILPSQFDKRKMQDPKFCGKFKFRRVSLNSAYDDDGEVSSSGSDLTILRGIAGLTDDPKEEMPCSQSRSMSGIVEKHVAH